MNEQQISALVDMQSAALCAQLTLNDVKELLEKQLASCQEPCPEIAAALGKVQLSLGMLDKAVPPF